MNLKLSLHVVNLCCPSRVILRSFLQAADLTKPIDKRVYKGTFPTCHDFNAFTAKEDSVLLLIGFTQGQIQLIDPEKKDYHKLFNEDVGLL